MGDCFNQTSCTDGPYDIDGAIEAATLQVNTLGLFAAFPATSYTQTFTLDAPGLGSMTATVHEAPDGRDYSLSWDMAGYSGSASSSDTALGAVSIFLAFNNAAGKIVARIALSGAGTDVCYDEQAGVTSADFALDVGDSVTATFTAGGTADGGNLSTGELSLTFGDAPPPMTVAACDGLPATPGPAVLATALPDGGHTWSNLVVKIDCCACEVCVVDPPPPADPCVVSTAEPLPPTELRRALRLLGRRD